MLFPILKEYRVRMQHKETDAKIEFTNYNPEIFYPDGIRTSARMARESRPDLRLVRITLERIIVLEDCFP